MSAANGKKPRRKTIATAEPYIVSPMPVVPGDGYPSTICVVMASVVVCRCGNTSRAHVEVPLAPTTRDNCAKLLWDVSRARLPEGWSEDLPDGSNCRKVVCPECKASVA